MAADYRTSWRARPDEAQLLMTRDAARVLGLTRTGVHWLVHTGRLTCVRTLAGWRVFRKRDVLRLVEQRALDRHPRLAMVRPRMARAQLRLPLQGAKGVLDTCRVKGRGFPKGSGLLT